MLSRMIEGGEKNEEEDQLVISNSSVMNPLSQQKSC